MSVATTSLNLDEAVRQWVALGSGLSFDNQVIDANQKRTPSPKGLYATVLEMSEIPEGLVFVRQPRNNQQRVQQSLTVAYSIQWFRKGARDAGRCFQLWAHSFPGIEAAEIRGLTLYSTGELRRLDAVDDYDWEERAGLDVTLGIVVQNDVPVQLVESVDVEACVD